MVGLIPGMEGKPMAPEMDPNLNGPMVAFLASEKAAHVNGQIFGRRLCLFSFRHAPKLIPLIGSIARKFGLNAAEV